MPLLKIKQLTLWYESVFGDIRALYHCACEVDKERITCVLGKNGAGKSSLFNTLAGVVDDDDGNIIEGQIVFNGENVTGLTAARLVSKGISLAPQGRHVFYTLSIEDNLYLGAGPLGVKMGGGTRRREGLDRVFSLFPVLKARRKQKAGTLSGGEQQMLSIARALMAGPKLLLLDEPFLGLSPAAVAHIVTALRQLKQEGMTIFMAEQNARAALSVADVVCIMADGFISGTGSADQWPLDKLIRHIYLGDQ